MIAIVDYGMGNIFSLCSSFKYIGADIELTSDIATIKKADKVIFPGVGAFRDAESKLRATGLDKVVIEEAKSGKPFLGICLGMQMMLTKSFEFGEYRGLDIIPGNVVSMEGVVPRDYKIPHIGWNKLIFPKDKPKSPIFRYVNEGECVYFVHSYYCTDCAPDTIATTEYGAELTAAIARDNVFGVQFHPEKSGEVGLNILRAFKEL
ncbi:MAG: imidazole glycerol phosphate synthase subunit HisH [Clostridia bacterium]|nr:imidazole glycerol phosphate synthase subunit HisH [Clostridia bacterium]